MGKVGTVGWQNTFVFLFIQAPPVSCFPSLCQVIGLKKEGSITRRTISKDVKKAEPDKLTKLQKQDKDRCEREEESRRKVEETKKCESTCNKKTKDCESECVEKFKKCKDLCDEKTADAN